MEHGLKDTAFYVQNIFSTLHCCHNFPADSRNAARGARICETSLFPHSVWRCCLHHNLRLTYCDLNKMPSLHTIFFYDFFVKEKFEILICILSQIACQGPFASEPALTQVMPWYQTGDKPLPVPMMANAIFIACLPYYHCSEPLLVTSMCP